MIRLCEKFKWDYHTFKMQPGFWIDSLFNYYSAEGEYQDKNGG